MSLISSLHALIFILAFYVKAAWGVCLAYGMDFQNGGSYFQNSLSSDPFTFVSEFTGCNDDIAYNILIDPNGDQFECSNTRLSPDSVDMLSTCPLQKDQLITGNWAIIVMSNNGPTGDPIAYQRDFSLSVGPQCTSTFIPTITATAVSTPIVNQTVTTTETTTTTLPPVTVTNPSETLCPTVTYTPPRVTTTSTKTLFTITLHQHTFTIVQATKTETATCTKPTRPSRADPTAKIVPTLKSVVDTVAGLKFTPPSAKLRRVADRAIVVARAPDPQPLVVTDTDTHHWGTVTSTSTAPAVTVSVTAATTTTTTSTPPPVTVVSGRTTLPAVTVTAPTPTRTVTRHTIATTEATKTISITYTITMTTTPASISSACRTVGGVF